MKKTKKLVIAIDREDADLIYESSYFLIVAGITLRDKAHKSALGERQALTFKDILTTKKYLKPHFDELDKIYKKYKNIYLKNKPKIVTKKGGK